MTNLIYVGFSDDVSIETWRWNYQIWCNFMTKTDIAGGLDLTEILEFVSIDTPEDILPAAKNLNRIARMREMNVALHDDMSSKWPMKDENGNSLNETVFGWATSDWWWDHPRFALYSPIMRACQYTSEPFWCNKDGIHGHKNNEYLDNIDTTPFFFAKGCNLKALIVVPVHLPFGQISTNSYPMIDSQEDDLTSHFEEHNILLKVMTARFISQYISVMSDLRPPNPRQLLTKREVECIRNAALGKTDNQIANDLSLGRSTIRFHMCNAASKLGARNRTETAVRAAQMGLLTTNSLNQN